MNDPQGDPLKICELMGSKLHKFVTHAELLEKCFYFVLYSQKDKEETWDITHISLMQAKEIRRPPQVVLAFLFLCIFFFFKVKAG